MARSAALFDMDRTLIRTDTARLFTRYRRDIGEASFRDSLQVFFWLIQYTLGVIDAPRVAQKVLEGFTGKEENSLIEQCQSWFPAYVLPHVLAHGRDAVKRHRDAGDFIAIVTGATQYAARPLACELGIEHVACTELEVDARGYFTGRIIEPLCFGEGKIDRARRLLERENLALEEATFYSDSITDLPLLERVKTPIAVNPDRRLRSIAARRGWQILAW